MALALIVREEHEELGISKKIANRFFFYIGGIATLTLVVNATTAQMLLVRLGLLKEDDSTMSKSLLNQAKFQIRERLLVDSESLVDHKYDSSFEGKISEADYLKFNTLLSSRENSLAENIRTMSITGQSNRFFGISDDNGGENANPLNNSNKTSRESPLNSEVITYCRQMLLESCRVKYWNFIEDGFLPRQNSVTQSLLYSIDSGLRRADFQARRDWDSLVKNMRMYAPLKLLVDAIRNYVPLGWTWLHRFGDRTETEKIYFKVRMSIKDCVVNILYMTNSIFHQLFLIAYCVC